MPRAFAILSLLPILLGQTGAQPGARASPASRPVEWYNLNASQFSKRPEIQERIAKEQVDIPLLEAAVFHESNRMRAENHLPLFRHSAALQLIARRHSEEMGKLQFFDHDSPTPANRTLSDRLKNVGMVNVTAGENIAVLPAREMGSGHYIVNENPDGSERLVDEATGKVIDYYSYQELAAAVVDKWMNSPPHRADLLDKRFSFLGVGVARGPYEDKQQDSFYFTQDFSATTSGASEAKARAALSASTRPAK